jgi:hypothetical protein
MTTNHLRMQVDPISEMPHQTYFRKWRMSNIFTMSQHPKLHVYEIYFRQWTMSSISMHQLIAVQIFRESFNPLKILNSNDNSILLYEYRCIIVMKQLNDHL